MEILLQSTIDLDKFVAFVSYGVVRDTGWETTAARVYIQDQNLSSYGRDYQVQTLTHELVHAAVAPIAGPFIRACIHEGLAEWEAYGQQVGKPGSIGGFKTLPRDYQFSTGSSPSIVVAYAACQSAITALARRSGKGAPTALIAALGHDQGGGGLDRSSISIARSAVRSGSGSSSSSSSGPVPDAHLFADRAVRSRR